MCCCPPSFNTYPPPLNVVFQVEASVLNIGKFNSMVSLAAFFPFKSAQAALENINAISEGKKRDACSADINVMMFNYLSIH